VTLYLLDTNVVSEAARTRPNAGVTAFLEREGNLCVSTVLFEELCYGLDMAPQEQKAKLIPFYEGVQAKFGARAIPVDLDVARTSGRLRGFARRQGRMLHMADAFMAATAIVHGATLVTRNTKDFVELGVELFDPFS
jgi:predicted nucleic acid-binding protein